MPRAEYAIIGGTGVYHPALLENPCTETVDTPYGPAQVTLGEYRGQSVAFMSRHGAGHQIPPHLVNYRANIWALKSLGVTQVFATAAVGSLRRDIKPGSLVIVDDFLDFTKSRPVTFFDQGTVVHVDMTDPYCARLRKALEDTATTLGLHVVHGGTYVCTEGPRFETPAEIRMYQSLGAAVVGMTSVPEVVLAKEAELCYATVCMVTNYAAGISDAPLTHDEVVSVMRAGVNTIRRLFFETLSRLNGERNCRCPRAVGGQSPLGAAVMEKEDRT
jgi:5'-methylthioadenosine phosphorylase